MQNKNHLINENVPKEVREPKLFQTSTTRRAFINTTSAAVAGLATSFALTSGNLLLGQETDAAKDSDAIGDPKFKLRFAPHPGTFKATVGDDVIDQINYCHERGFTAIEYNRIEKESPEMQTKIGETLAKNGMQMGVFVAYADFNTPSFADPRKATTEKILAKMKTAVEIAKRCNAKFMTVVPGSVDQRIVGSKEYRATILAEGYQFANVIELLRRCAEILEPHDLVMVLEPLNWHANHGGTFLQKSDQAYAVCKAVNSPSCKILFDIYHQQISEGNLIPNINLCWDEIGYFQSGDNPGRKEPGTGEINYKNVFKAIGKRSKEEGRNLIIGMEHGNSIKGKEGDDALIAAYRAVDLD